MKNEVIFEKLGIQKITIPLPFRLDHVHCFLVKGATGYTLIDTGLHDEQAKKIWQEKLPGKDVEKIILTHLHPDHTGYAGVLQKQTNAPVYMSEIDAKAMQTIWQEEAIPLLQRDYHTFAVPEQMTEKIIQLIRKTTNIVEPTPNVHQFLRDGETINIGDYTYDIIATPGHAEGLVCLYEPETKVLLSTDHVLPKITPNIAYWFYGEKNPLLSYKTSLEKIKKLDISYVIPSHGEPFEDVYTRIDEIWTHHEERIEKTYDAMKNGITVFDMCDILFPYELSMYDYQFAIGEAVAHMEYVRHEGRCERTIESGVYIYQSLT